ncbi:hypothetical protein TNCV_3176791 [Trichonephila clavipes]|nr:hypothetical protein TNCV_3176791 [Trichonephila clavipes]
MAEEKLLDHIISRLEPQLLDYVEVRYSQTTSSLPQLIDKYEERFKNRMTRVRVMISETQLVARIINSQTGIGRRTGGIPELTTDIMTLADRSDRRRSDQSDHRFNNHGGRQGGSRNGAFMGQNGQNRYLNFQATDKPGLTHVLYHEIDTGDQGPVVSRPYRYDRVKQGIIDYHIEKMLEGSIRSIQSPYASPVVITCKNNGLPPNSPGGLGSRKVRVSDRGLPCHEFENSTTKDPPCRAAVHVKSVES